jgi:hypothetical protein
MRVSKIKLTHFYSMIKILIAYAVTYSDAVARGGTGGGGDGGLFFGLIGVAIAFFLCKEVGAAISPNSKSSDQMFLGFIVILSCIALLLSIFK